MSEYHQAEIAKYLKKLFAEIKQLDTRLSALERAQSGVEPVAVYAGSGSPFSPFTFSPVRVTAVSSDGYYCSGMIQYASVDCSTPWNDDSVYTSAVTVHVASPKSPPEVGDVIVSFYTGAVGAGYTPVWGTFDKFPGMMICNATAAQTVTSGMSFYQANNIAPLFGASPVTTLTDIVTIYNRYADDIDNAGKISIEYDGTNSRWQTGQITCPA